MRIAEGPRLGLGLRGKTVNRTFLDQGHAMRENRMVQSYSQVIPASAEKA